MSAVVAELRSLYERDGDLTPEAVLEAAADPTSALHASFVWDDTEAARRFRLNQAQGLIRRVKVTIVGGDEQTHRVRAYLNIPNPDGGKGRYVSTQEALAGEHRDVVLQQAIREVAALRRKYRGLVDFDEVLRSNLITEEAAAS